MDRIKTVMAYASTTAIIILVVLTMGSDAFSSRSNV